MPELYNVRLCDDVVEVELGDTFVIALRQMLPLWAEILEVCREQACSRVLVEGHRPRRDMDLVEVAKHGDFVQALDGPGIRVAFCLYDYPADALTDRFHLVANAGHSRVEFFTTRDEALAWLRARDAAAR